MITMQTFPSAVSAANCGILAMQRKRKGMFALTVKRISQGG